MTQRSVEQVRIVFDPFVCLFLVPAVLVASGVLGSTLSEGGRRLSPPTRDESPSWTREA